MDGDFNEEVDNYDWMFEDAKGPSKTGLSMNNSEYVNSATRNQKRQSSKHRSDESVFVAALNKRQVKYTSAMRNKICAVMHETFTRRWRRGLCNAKHAPYKCDGKQLCGVTIFVSSVTGTL